MMLVPYITSPDWKKREIALFGSMNVLFLFILFYSILKWGPRREDSVNLIFFVTLISLMIDGMHITNRTSDFKFSIRCK